MKTATLWILRIEGNKIRLAQRSDNKALNESRTNINQGLNESGLATKNISSLGRTLSPTRHRYFGQQYIKPKVYPRLEAQPT